ncbi:MAG: carboxylating nicotinate-nucleotide diphosphorylase [Chloroflexia bacterium]|nr:carboxylating nicotinate-nucleotide diphosphorylase [Chloroflexia bacterium]
MTAEPQALSRRGWEAIVDLALDEDIGTGDITTMATVPATTQAHGTILAKQAGVISGVEVARFVFGRVDPAVAFEPLVTDGQRVPALTPLARVSGSARSLLTAERTGLNLMQRLSGVATITARYVAETEGSVSRVVDTRKTTPGLRLLEKLAVQHGGGHNHRFGLADGVLIKDNHLAAIGGPDRVTKAIRSARELAPHTLKIEVEVTTLDELDEALAAGADIILLDNMGDGQVAEAVARRDAVDPRILLEASGGITVERIRHLAATRVDLISCGALTHSAPALDISFDLDIGPLELPFITCAT